MALRAATSKAVQSRVLSARAFSTAKDIKFGTEVCNAMQCGKEFSHGCDKRCVLVFWPVLLASFWMKTWHRAAMWHILLSGAAISECPQARAKMLAGVDKLADAVQVRTTGNSSGSSAEGASPSACARLAEAGPSRTAAGTSPGRFTAGGLASCAWPG